MSRDRRDPPSPSRRRLLVLGALWVSISAVALLAPGCYGRNCEGSVATYGGDAGEGRMLSDDMWESNPQDGTWLWFPRERTYVFDIRPLAGRTPQLVQPYLSAVAEPSKTGNFTPGGGNVTLLSFARPNGINVTNDTCSDYFLRLVVVAAPLPPTLPDAAAPTTDASGLEDAGGDADAGAVVDAGDTEAGP
jgi:hypothetical protein